MLLYQVLRRRNRMIGLSQPHFALNVGHDSIIQYLNFLEKWYSDRAHTLSEEAQEKFRNKLDGILKEWPTKLSYLVVIVMKRQALPDKLLPEWEELCAVATSVQNFHLMATSLGLGVFWSSHTWCKDGRDSAEMKHYLNFKDEDRILGALTVGRYDPSRKFTSTRTPIDKKLQYRC